MTIGILLLTKDRYEYAARSLRAVLHSAEATHDLHVHIASDGSEPGHIDRLLYDISRYELCGVTSSETGGHSYGASYNLALQTVHFHCETILVLEDDWECIVNLDLDRLVSALEDPRIGCIRLGYLGWTEPLRGEFIRANGVLGLLLDPNSPERHVFAGHPRLETREWQRRVGPWPEGVDPGTTEHLVAGLTNARTGVMWPLSESCAFAHIGTVQARKDQQ